MLARPSAPENTPELTPHDGWLWLPKVVDPSRPGRETRLSRPLARLLDRSVRHAARLHPLEQVVRFRCRTARLDSRCIPDVSAEVHVIGTPRPRVPVRLALSPGRRLGHTTMGAVPSRAGRAVGVWSWEPRHGAAVGCAAPFPRRSWPGSTWPPFRSPLDRQVLMSARPGVPARAGALDRVVGRAMRRWEYARLSRASGAGGWSRSRESTVGRAEPRERQWSGDGGSGQRALGGAACVRHGTPPDRCP
jgi:hypothetical protein